MSPQTRRVKDTKQDRDVYRDQARQLYERAGLTVAPHAFVHPTYGGAFVEAMVWVPDLDLRPIGTTKRPPSSIKKRR